jgi:hypothetical protein
MTITLDTLIAAAQRIYFGQNVTAPWDELTEDQQDYYIRLAIACLNGIRIEPYPVIQSQEIDHAELAIRRGPNMSKAIAAQLGEFLDQRSKEASLNVFGTGGDLESVWKLIKDRRQRSSFPTISGFTFAIKP